MGPLETWSVKTQIKTTDNFPNISNPHTTHKHLNTIAYHNPINYLRNVKKKSPPINKHIPYRCVFCCELRFLILEKSFTDVVSGMNCLMCGWYVDALLGKALLPYFRIFVDRHFTENRCLLPENITYGLTIERCIFTFGKKCAAVKDKTCLFCGGIKCLTVGRTFVLIFGWRFFGLLGEDFFDFWEKKTNTF